MVVREDEAGGSEQVDGVEREDDATALFSSVLGNLDGEGHQIEDCERTFTGINVCPHWSATFSTMIPKRDNKNS